MWIMSIKYEFVRTYICVCESSPSENNKSGGKYDSRYENDGNDTKIKK